MKRSRIICSIITVVYVLLSLALILMLVKSNISMKSGVNANIKLVHVGAFAACTFMYIGVKKKLAKKLNNKPWGIIVSRIYCYLYLAVIVFVSRLIMLYVIKGDNIQQLVPGFNIGLGSYINYGLGLLIKNQMYANVVINSILVFLSGIVIKKLLLNITENDVIATTASIMYVLLPQSLVYVTEYVRYNYNVVIMLFGMLVFTKIIDEVKNFNKKSNKYLVYSIILGLIQSLDVVLGTSYVLWVSMLFVTTIAATYIDIVHINIKFKEKLSFKLKILAEKIERINIPKLVYVMLTSLGISGITTLFYGIFSSANNYQMFSVENSIKLIMHSRSYYLVLIICALVFEIIGVVLKRKLDIKMFMVKIAFILVMILTFFSVDGIYASAVFDTLLVLVTIINVCNICYNREQRVKLLKDKN